jgi:ankyrin repeat protein
MDLSCNLCSQGGATPLHNAAARGHVEVAALLLDRGANIEAANEVSMVIAVCDRKPDGPSNVAGCRHLLAST